MNDNPGNQPWGPNNQGQWQPNSGSDPQSWGSPNQQPQNWQSPSQQSWSDQGQGQQPGQAGPYDGATQTCPAADQNSWGSANDPNQGQWSGQQQPGQGSPTWDNTGQQAQWASQPPNGGAGGPGAPGGQGGSRKGLGIGIAIVAVVLVAAIGLAFFLVNRNKSDSAGGSSSKSANPNAIIDKPDAALKDYFDALIKGDAKRALKYGSSTNTGSSKYLTNEMLKASQKANPISSVEISGDTSSDSSASLSADYNIGDESVTATYRMYRSGKGSRWQMSRAASDVDLSTLGSDTLKINGVSIAVATCDLRPDSSALPHITLRSLLSTRVMASGPPASRWSSCLSRTGSRWAVTVATSRSRRVSLVAVSAQGVARREADVVLKATPEASTQWKPCWSRTW